MKHHLPFLVVLVLCGCRTSAPVATLSVPAPISVRPQPDPVVAPPRLARPTNTLPDPRSRQQAQLIEALINQNDALTARLAALQAAPTATSTTPESAPVSVQPSSPAPVSLATPTVVMAEPAIAPNAEGIIDLTAIEQAGNADEPINPFAVRTAPGEKTREVTLLVGGIILGKTPCAVVNERLVQSGDSFEGFVVERIETGAVVVRSGVHRLRLPVSPSPTRVKLAL